MMSFNIHPIRGALLCLSLFLLAGCAGLGRYSEAPKVSVADIQVAEVKTLEAAFLLQLRIINPSDKTLEVKGVDCTLELDDRSFAHGVTGEAVSVPAYGSELVPVTVYSSMFDMVGSVIGFISKRQGSIVADKPLNYRLAGNIRLSNGGILKRIPFKTVGEFTLDGFYRDK